MGLILFGEKAEEEEQKRRGGTGRRRWRRMRRGRKDRNKSPLSVVGWRKVELGETWWPATCCDLHIPLHLLPKSLSIPSESPGSCPSRPTLTPTGTLCLVSLLKQNKTKKCLILLSPSLPDKYKHSVPPFFPVQSTAAEDRF